MLINAGKYLTYRELYRRSRSISNEKIMDFINYFSMDSLLKRLSFLLKYSTLNIDKIYKEEFKKYLKNRNEKFHNNEYNSSVITTRHVIMKTMEWVVVKKYKKESGGRQASVLDVLMLCIMIADKLNTKQPYNNFSDWLYNIYPEIQRNAYANSINKDNIFNAINRTHKYFLDILLQRNDDIALYPEYILNCVELFIEKYGYTLEGYSNFFKALAVYSQALYDNNKLLFEVALEDDDVSDCREEFTIDVKGFYEEIKDDYLSNWCLSPFLNYAFLRVDDKIINLNHSMVVDNYALQIKFKMLDIYSDKKDRDQFLSLYGRLQEQYISKIIIETLNDTSDVRVVEEFKYRKNGGECRSSDAYIIIDNSVLLVFESKGKNFTMDDKFTEGPMYYYGTENKLSVDAVRQAIKTLDYIRKNNHVANIMSGINKVYIFAVSAERMPINPYAYDYFDSLVKIMMDDYSNIGKLINGYFHFGMIDLENLIKVIKKNPLKTVSILQDMFESKMSFNDYICYNRIWDYIA